MDARKNQMIENACEKIRVAHLRRGGSLELKTEYKGSEVQQETDKYITDEFKRIEGGFQQIPNFQEMLQPIRAHLSQELSKQFDELRKAGARPQFLDMSKQLQDFKQATEDKKLNLSADQQQTLLHQVTDLSRHIQEKAFADQAQFLLRQVEKEQQEKINLLKIGYQKTGLLFELDPELVDITEEEDKKTKRPVVRAGLDDYPAMTEEEKAACMFKVSSDLGQEGYLKIVGDDNNTFRVHQFKDNNGNWSVKPMHTDGSAVTKEDYARVMAFLMNKGHNSITVNFPAIKEKGWLREKLIGKQLDTLRDIFELAKQRGLTVKLGKGTQKLVEGEAKEYYGKLTYYQRLKKMGKNLVGLELSDLEERGSKVKLIQSYSDESEAISQRRKIMSGETLREARAKLNEEPKSLHLRAEEASAEVKRLEEIKRAADAEEKRAHQELSDAKAGGAAATPVQQAALDKARQDALTAGSEFATANNKATDLQGELKAIDLAKQQVKDAENKLEEIKKINVLFKAQSEFDSKNPAEYYDALQVWLDTRIALADQHIAVATQQLKEAPDEKLTEIIQIEQQMKADLAEYQIMKNFQQAQLKLDDKQVDEKTQAIAIADLEQARQEALTKLKKYIAPAEQTAVYNKQKAIQELEASLRAAKLTIPVPQDVKNIEEEYNQARTELKTSKQQLLNAQKDEKNIQEFFSNLKNYSVRELLKSQGKVVLSGEDALAAEGTLTAAQARLKKLEDKQTLIEKLDHMTAAIHALEEAHASIVKSGVAFPGTDAKSTGNNDFFYSQVSEYLDLIGEKPSADVQYDNESSKANIRAALKDLSKKAEEVGDAAITNKINKLQERADAAYEQFENRIAIVPTKSLDSALGPLNR